MTDDRLSRWLTPVSRRMRLRRGLRWGITALAAGAGLATALLAVARLIPLGWEQPVAATLVAAPALVGVLAGLSAPLKPSLVARAADRDLDSGDRIATSLELKGAPDRFRIGREQIDATEELLSGIRSQLAAPMRLPQRVSVLAALGLAAASLLLYLPNPAHAELDRRAAEARAVEEEAEKIKERAEELRKDADASPETEALAEELEQLGSKLEETESIEEALQEIARAEGELEELTRQDHLATKALIRDFERSTEEDPLSDGIEGSLAEQLEALDEQLGELSEEERQKAADDLEGLAESLQASEPQLSEALSEAADALRSGSSSGELSAAAEAARDTEARLEAQEDLSASRSELSESRGRLSEAQGQIEQGSEGSAGEEDGEGSSGDQGSENGESSSGSGSEEGSQGSGAEGSEGSEGQGSDEGEGQGTGQSGTSPESGGGQGQGLGPSGLGDSPIYDPIFGGELSESLQAEGEILDGRRETTGSTGSGPTFNGQILIPYRYTYPEWSAQASRTVEVLPVPASLRSFVRAYFSSLAPD